jgi:hypothetical protein
MKITPTKKVLREMLRQLGIKAKFVHYFAENVHGKLLPSERRILINASKHRDEHVFTVLHEIAHYVLHFKRRANRRLCPWYLKINWKIDAVAAFFSKVRRGVRLYFNCDKGKEWEADAWAMCGLVYLKKFAGFSDLPTFLARHPEKQRMYWYATAAVTYTGVKSRISGVAQFFRKARRRFSSELARLRRESRI